MQFENDRLDFPENMINLADFFNKMEKIWEIILIFRLKASSEELSYCIE